MQEILVEMTDQGTGVNRHCREAVGGPVEQLGQRSQRGHAGSGDLLDLDVLVEGERGQTNRVPSADARFLALYGQRSGRASRCDPPVFAEKVA